MIKLRPLRSITTYMSFMFYSSSFNQDVSEWDVSNVTNMSYMFYEATLVRCCGLYSFFDAVTV